MRLVRQSLVPTHVRRQRRVLLLVFFMAPTLFVVGLIVAAGRV